MGRIARSVQLFSITWKVLLSDTRMLVFPLLSALFAVLLLIPLLLTVVATWAYASSNTPAGRDDMFISLVIAFIYYLIVLILSTYFNAALVYFADRTLAGKPASISESFAMVTKRLPLIIAWAIVSATIGMLLRLLAQSHEIIEDIITLVLGLAWSMISFLALPILVLENKNPVTALKEAVQLVRRAWGEQVILSTGFGLVFALIYLAAIGLFVLAIKIGDANLAHILMTMAVVMILIGGLLHMTLARIFETALYNYARTGTVYALYNKEIFERAVTKRRRRATSL